MGRRAKDLFFLKMSSVPSNKVAIALSFVRRYLGKSFSFSSYDVFLTFFLNIRPEALAFLKNIKQKKGGGALAPPLLLIRFSLVEYIYIYALQNYQTEFINHLSNKH